MGHIPVDCRGTGIFNSTRPNLKLRLVKHLSLNIRFTTLCRLFAARQDLLSTLQLRLARSHLTNSLLPTFQAPDEEQNPNSANFNLSPNMKLHYIGVRPIDCSTIFPAALHRILCFRAAYGLSTNMALFRDRLSATTLSPLTRLSQRRS